MSGNIQIRYRKQPAPGSAERGPTWVTPPVQYIKGGKGDVGDAGPPAGVPYTFSTTTTMADPGAGGVRFNHATPASVTAIALDDLSAATGNPDVSAWIAAMAGSTNTVKGSLRVTLASNQAIFAEFNITAVTASGGWEQLTVAFVNSAGTLADGAAVQVSFARAGNVGTNGAYAAADAVEIPGLTDYRPVQISGVSKRAYLMDGIPFSFANALADGGRFAGSPESNSVAASTWTSPPYLVGYNGTTFVQGAKRVNNTSTYGGSGAALDADVQALVEAMQPGAGAGYWRYGPEFYLADFTCPASMTINPLAVGGVTHYLTMANGSFPLPLVHAVHCWFKVTSGSAAVLASSGTDRRVFVDGAELSVSTAYGVGAWHRLGIYYIRSASAFAGYYGSLFQLYGTPTTTFHFAAPVLMLGHAYKGGLIGVVPSVGAIR